MNKHVFFLIAFSLFLLSCSKSEEPRTTWTFANHASQTVGVFNIAPKGQPDMLELHPDTTVDVTIVGDKLDYDFGPADAVVRDRSADCNLIIFSDKQSQQDSKTE